MLTLRDMGDLRTGYQTRGAVDPVPEGPHRIVMLGDVRDGGVDWGHIDRTDLGHARAEDFLVTGDIIIRTRGAHFGVVMISDPPAGTVAAAPLFVLTIRRPDILPEYVAWYLNRPSTHSILERMARGTSLPTISIRDLAEMEIPVPIPEVQHQIIEIARLVKQERDLSRRLIECRALLADTVSDALSQGKRRKRVASAEPPTRLIEFD